MAELNKPEAAPENPVLQRVSTGIAGLDIIMTGGLLGRATHLIGGASGTGKTVLTQQVAYYQAALGNNVLYLTILSESHEKLISNLNGFSFYDEKLVGTRLHYLSFYHEIATGGIANLIPACRSAILKYKAKLVIIDGVSSLRDFAISRGELRKVLFDLNAHLSALSCTVLLIVDDELPPQNAPEYAIADTIIRLNNQSFHMRHLRTLEVLKARATPALTGQHFFDIAANGIVVYPRIEALLSNEKNDPPPSPGPERHAFGIAGLDQMLQGGLPVGSINIHLGTPGSGKTLTGLHFIYEGARQNERTLALSFHHSTERICTKSARLGFDMKPYLEDGTLKIIWALAAERSLDEVVGQLLNAIEEHKPSRLLIDALSDLEALSFQRDGLQFFWATLTNYLRNRKITTIGTLENNRITGDTFIVPERPISIIADTILLSYTVEIESKLKNTISILEMRDSDYDNQVREYLINTKDGLRVGEPFKNTEMLLTGTGRVRHPRQKRSS